MTLGFVFSLFFFSFGACVGSFLNCLVYRFEKKENFIKGRSFCPHCHHFLSWKDLIPIFSFFFLKGKCRYCQEKISWQYPLVEIVTAFLFLFLWKKFQLQFLDLFFLLLIFPFLIFFFVYDLKYYLIPDEIVYPAIFLAIFWKITLYFLGKISLWQLKIIFLSALFPTLFFLAIHYFSAGKAMGLGDANLTFLMGIILSWPKIVIALFLSFFLGAFLGIFLLLFKKKNLKSEIPFAPFLVVGTVLAIFFVPETISLF